MSSGNGENALVEWLRERFPVDAARVPIGIGDDMAAVRFDGALVAVTTDMLLEGVHFDRREHGYDLIGWKALGCSLSDCAGMGCRPRFATVSLGLPSTMSFEQVKMLYEGMSRIADEFKCAIVGGDTNSWAGGLVVDVAMMGEPMDVRGLVRRCDARVGDTIYVSGRLGGSILGRHLTFVPRLELAEHLVRESGLHAMMDISDGLGLDLHRLCTASGCDAELIAEQVELAISDDARTLASRDGRPVMEHALGDGEDFELLVVGEGLDESELGLIAVGRIVDRRAADQSELTMVHADGRRAYLEPVGYEHFKSQI